jgi:hypothetical protein
MSTAPDTAECSDCGMDYPRSELKKGGLVGGELVCHSCRTCIAEDCDERSDDGEGYDGYCGNCADRLENKGHWD